MKKVDTVYVIEQEVKYTRHGSEISKRKAYFSEKTARRSFENEKQWLINSVASIKASLWLYSVGAEQIEDYWEVTKV